MNIFKKISNHYQEWRFKVFLVNFQKSIQRYNNMMLYGGIKRKRRRRVTKSLLSRYKITTEKLLNTIKISEV